MDEVHSFLMFVNKNWPRNRQKKMKNVENVQRALRVRGCVSSLHCLRSPSACYKWKKNERNLLLNKRKKSAVVVYYKRKKSAVVVSTFFSQRIQIPNWLLEMYDWNEMAEFVGRKLVENGQERILQRIFDGVNSIFVLDISDFKESDNHKLLHLVWRKSPRNKSSTEGLKTTISDSTQTNEDIRPGPLHVSRNYVASNSDCLSRTDLRDLFDMNESVSNSESGSTSDGSLHSTDLAALETASFTFPAKGQSSKPRTLEITKSQNNLSNRFECLKYDIPTNDNTSEEIRKSPLPSPGTGELTHVKLLHKLLRLLRV